MARPPHDPSRAPTRDRLMSAAADVFGDAGFDRAGLAEIATRAGVSRPSLLHHFPSKEALYAEVVEETFAAIGTSLAASMGPGDAVTQLVGMARAFEALFDRRPAWARIVVRELLDEGPGHVILTRQVARLLDAVVAHIETTHAAALRADLSVREAVLQIASAVLIRAASPARHALWTGPSQLDALVRHLLLTEPPCAPSATSSPT